MQSLEAWYQGRDLFVSTGTGSGKTECFLWPLMGKLADEAVNRADSWKKRGVRAVVMYPMNALVSDQGSRLRRLIGDPEGRFVEIFRDLSGKNSRRPQFGMYTGRTPYAGPEPVERKDKALVRTLQRFLEPSGGVEREYYQKLVKEGKIPAKADLETFLGNLRERIMSRIRRTRSSSPAL